jgi:hypothetical protein
MIPFEKIAYERSSHVYEWRACQSRSVRDANHRKEMSAKVASRAAEGWQDVGRIGP